MIASGLHILKWWHIKNFTEFCYISQALYTHTFKVPTLTLYIVSFPISEFEKVHVCMCVCLCVCHCQGQLDELQYLPHDPERDIVVKKKKKKNKPFCGHLMSIGQIYHVVSKKKEHIFKKMYSKTSLWSSITAYGILFNCRENIKYRQMTAEGHSIK